MADELVEALGLRLVHPSNLEHDGSRLHHRNPMIDGTLPFSHTGFSRVLGDRLVREDPDPDLGVTVGLAGDRGPARFDLLTGDPRRSKRLNPVLAEDYLIPRVAFPFIRPRCIFLYLVLFGKRSGILSHLVLSALSLGRVLPRKTQALTPMFPYLVWASVNP